MKQLKVMISTNSQLRSLGISGMKASDTDIIDILTYLIDKLDNLKALK